MTRMIAKCIAVAAPLTGFVAFAEAQPRVARIGVITTDASSVPIDAFRQRLAELGYIDGRDIAIDVRSWGTQPEKQAALTAEVIALGAAVVVTGGTLATRAA